MRRATGIFVLLAFAALASGGARYVHELHAHHHDAAHHESEPTPSHDESHCLIHALLKLPMLGGGFVPLLAFVGLFVAFLSLMPTPVRSRRPILRLDCRGPPAMAPAVTAI